MVGPIRPRANEPVTLLLQAGTAPVSDVTRVGAVDGHSLMLPRTAAARVLDVAAGTAATVLFIYDGRLYRWPMLVEEVLPSTWLLASVREPGEGERREFVRADVPMQVRLRERPDGPWRQASARVDLSASGFRVETMKPPIESGIVDVELRSADGGGAVCALARVVRTILNPDGAADVAFAFVELDSAAESRVVDLVFAVREAALRARLGS